MRFDDLSEEEKDEIREKLIKELSPDMQNAVNIAGSHMNKCVMAMDALNIDKRVATFAIAEMALSMLVAIMIKDETPADLMHECIQKMTNKGIFVAEKAWVIARARAREMM